MIIDHLKFNIDTRLFPIIGYPMGQSTAPYAYNPLLAANDTNEVMWPVEVKPEDLGDFMATARTLGIRHIALTMPLKAKIIPFLDEVEESSRLFNSVNIVRIDPDGRAIGEGMDGRGNLAALKKAGVDLNGRRLVMLGAGSIVGCILTQMEKAGVKQATLINRSLENAAALVDFVSPHLSMKIDVLPFTDESLEKAASDCDLLMQSTPLGMFGFGSDYDNLDFIDRLPNHAVVMENIVNPPKTAFAQRAEARGLQVVYGVDMMLGQLSEIFNFSFGYYPKPEHMEAAKKSIYGRFGLPVES